MRKVIFILLSFSIVIISPLYAQQKRLHITSSDTLCGEEAEVQIRRMWDELQQSWFARIADYQIHSQLTMPEVASDSASRDSVNILRLQALLNTTVFPMVYNDEIRRYINLYTKGLKSMPLILARAQVYFPMYEEVLSKYGVPLELKYLSVIESSLRPEAISPAGAVGLWQFMYGTGKLYGLEVTTYVDDRMNPAKATDAAARHLNDLAAFFDGNWPLALAAYNCGPGNVLKAIKRSGGAQDFWKIYNYLPRETRGYVPAFYGAMFAMKYYGLYGLEAAKINVEAVDTIIIYKKLNLQKVSVVTGIPIDELKYYNPQYRRSVIPSTETGLTLTLPTKYIMLFEELKDSIYRMQEQVDKARVEIPTQESVTAKGSYSYKNKYHVVKNGETLSSIARKYGTTVEKIQSMNHRRSTMIHPGDRLIVGQNKIFVANTKSSAKDTSQHGVSGKISPDSTTTSSTDTLKLN